jgi:hypothetical protein
MTLASRRIECQTGYVLTSLDDKIEGFYRYVVRTGYDFSTDHDIPNLLLQYCIIGDHSRDDSWDVARCCAIGNRSFVPPKDSHSHHRGHISRTFSFYISYHINYSHDANSSRRQSSCFRQASSKKCCFHCSSNDELCCSFR